MAPSTGRASKVVKTTLRRLDNEYLGAVTRRRWEKRSSSRKLTMAHVYRVCVCVVYTKELFSNITGICILHGRATLDDPMFSPDHPALSFGNLWFACVSSVFFSSLSVQVCFL